MGQWRFIIRSEYGKYRLNNNKSPVPCWLLIIYLHKMLMDVFNYF
ncbi:hypothetical protein SALWKB2_0395 [Snodgrassella alvi wkB2]|nr:hypothetical protein SALWKB2_0395 [Snodgrassella alvi wkB2]